MAVYGTTVSSAQYGRTTGALAHEDLSNVLKRLEPAETPMLSMCRVGSQLGNVQFDWEVDKWPTPAGANGVVDGASVTDASVADNAAYRRRMANYGQAFRRAFGEGWIASKVLKLPGQGGSGIAKAAADQLVVLKQEMECAICSTDQTATGDTGSAGSLMSGIGKLASRNSGEYFGTSGSDDNTAIRIGQAPFSFIPPADAWVVGEPRGNLSLSMLKGVVKALRKVTKRNRDYACPCGLDLREDFSALTEPSAIAVAGGAGVSGQTRTFMQQLSDAELGSVIDVIRTDYGRLLVMPTDWIGTTMTDQVSSAYVFTEKPKFGYVLPREILEVRYGVTPELNELPNSGQGTRKYWQAFAGLVLSTPQPVGRLFMS